MTTTTTNRIPLNTFAIGFGLAGLAEAWGAAGVSLRLPSILAQVFWLGATLAWLWLLVAHAVRGARSDESTAHQLRHPAQGPVAALAPITGMLISGELLTVARPVGLVLFIVSLVIAALFAAWLGGNWLQGGLALESVHGGYLLPTVAAGFVGSGVAAKAGLTLLAWGLFGVGTFFWVVMTLLLIIRLAFRPSLPDPLVPTMAILVAPPAVAGLAWFDLGGLHASAVAAMIAGLGVLLFLIQLALLPKYLKLGFSLGFWSFTFPAAAVVTDTILWLRLTPALFEELGTAVLLSALTILIGSIGIRSLLAVFPLRRRRDAESALTRANYAG